MRKRFVIILCLAVCGLIQALAQADAGCAGDISLLAESAIEPHHSADSILADGIWPHHGEDFTLANGIEPHHNADSTLADSIMVSDSLSAPKPKKRFFLLRLLDKALAVDTNYIERNKYNLTLMTRSDWRYKMIWLRGRDDADKSHQTLYFHPKSQVTIGPYVGYSLLFLGWTINIGSDITSNNSNLYLSLYAPMFGVDYYYERGVNGYRISRISGFSKEIKEASRDQDFPGLSTHMKYLHFYYIFNHRHFSYPAAYSQSTVQRRSSGAFILGYTYSLQKIDFNYEQLPSAFYDAGGNLMLNSALQVHEVRYHNHSISLGYTYNWVFARNFLFNISTAPAIGYNFTRGENITSEKMYRLSNINFDFIGKLAVVWNTGRLFAGGSFTAHTYAYRKSTFSCQNILLGAQLYMGINLWAKKAYRKHKSKKDN